MHILTVRMGEGIQTFERFRLQTTMIEVSEIYLNSDWHKAIVLNTKNALLSSFELDPDKVMCLDMA